MEWLGMAPIEQALIRAGGLGWKVGDWKETGVRLLRWYDHRRPRRSMCH